MVHILVGAAATAGLFLIIDFSRKRKLKVTYLQWLLTVMAIAYSVFVIEVIISFIHEGCFRGALIMGVIMGFVAVVWSVLLGRFVFLKSR